MQVTEPRKYFCQWYTGVSNKPEKEFALQPTEVENVRWVDLPSLINDLEINPDKYVPSMSLAVKAFSSI